MSGRETRGPLESHYGRRPKLLPNSVRLALAGLALIAAGLVLYNVAKIGAIVAMIGLVMFLASLVLAHINDR